MKVIGLTGPARAGKDTVAAMIREELPELTVRREGFADRLKLSAALALGYTPEDMEDAVALCDELKVTGVVVVGTVLETEGARYHHLSGREFLQRYGTEAHREVFGEDFWVDALLPPTFAKHPWVDALLPPTFAKHPAEVENLGSPDVLVVPDCRFPNEAHRVREYGGEVWEVYRPDTQPVEAHSSEAGLPDGLIDRVVQNTGTLDELRERVRVTLGQAGLRS